jgi:hypothetical protein
MSVRRELFRLWCVLVAVVWFVAIFNGDWGRAIQKFQAGGLQAALTQFGSILTVTVVVPLVVLLVGRAAFWTIDQLLRK